MVSSSEWLISGCYKVAMMFWVIIRLLWVVALAFWAFFFCLKVILGDFRWLLGALGGFVAF